MSKKRRAEQAVGLGPIDYEAMFPHERRTELLNQASRDRHGRPVVYYRYMQRDIFHRLVEQGSITALDHNPHPRKRIGEVMIAQSIARLLDDDSEEHKPRRYHRVAEILPRLERYDAAFAQKLAALAVKRAFTPKNIQPLFYEHFDRQLLRRMHAAGWDLSISPYLSLSAGCVIRNYVAPGQVYVEFVVPDQAIELSPDSVKGEKEVLVRELQREWVTRVYADTRQLVDEIIFDPTTPVGKYYQPSECGTFMQQMSAVNEWRWGESIEDYLPVDLLQHP